ncbi:MAG: hypothetical protein ACM359_01775 [Bacillota bacterium]
MQRATQLASPANQVQELYCPVCNYNLFGIKSSRCPECGQEFDRLELAQPQIPWLYRRQVGWIKAYWQTAFQATFRVRKLARESAKPVSYRDARLFRWVTLLWVYLCLAGVAVAGHFLTWPRGDVDQLFSWLSLNASYSWWGGLRVWLGLVVAPGSFVLSLLAVLLFLMAATGVPGWFFHPSSLPRVRQNRAVALSQYACAPLAWVPVLMLLIYGVNQLGSWWTPMRIGSGSYAINLTRAFDLAYRLTWALLCIVPVLWWYNTLLLLRGTTQADLGRLFATGLLLPALWLFLAVFFFAGLHLVVSYLVLVASSLRGGYG